jgi:hypothetical protein
MSPLDDSSGSGKAQRTIGEMASARRHLGAIAVGVAAAGVLIGHWLTYGVESPNAAGRAQMLARTGHSYLHLANDVGLALGLTALVSLTISELSSPTEPRSFGWFASRLALVQTVTFGSMEVVERLVAHAPLATLLHGGLIVVGVLIQVAVAAAGAVLLRWLHRAAGTLRSLVGSARFAPPTPALTSVPDAPVRPRRIAVRRVGARAPPVCV